jgi:hypothetical protein
MDNIQKALVTVLGVAAMIAMLVPSKDPIDAPSTQSDAVEQPAPPSEASNNPVVQNPSTQPVPQAESTPDESFQIGQPSIDGKPIQPDFGMPYGVSAPDANQPANSNGAGESAPITSESTGSDQAGVT